jgi:WD40-like Beta Propeller Repeat
MRLRWTAFVVVAVLTILTSSCSSSNGNQVAPGQPNPTPIITGLFPSSVTAGSQSFTMFIAGTGFITGSTGTSTAFWNGSPRSATVNLNTGQIAVTVLASDIATPGTSLVTVSNPLPGGGISINAAPFTVFPTQTNTPLIAGLSPATASPNGAAFTLTVNGSNFIAGNANIPNPTMPPTAPYSGSVVAWNGSPRTTAFVNSTQLTAQITQQDIQSSGCNGISVFTYTGGGNEIYSPTASFIASSTGAPAICSLAPASVVAGASDFTITVTGASFGANATVRWNNSARTTTFVNANTVQAQIKAADVANAGSEPVTVANPSGITPALNFAILPTPPVTPTITALAPASATLLGGAFTLTVTGTNFLRDSVVDWNGAARATSFQSATVLKAQILATDLTLPGTVQITVLNTSSNGAGAFSEPFPFTINPAAGAAVKFPQVVSASALGGPADGASEAPAISSGGRYVAFYSQAKNLITPAVSGNIFVRDTCVGAANSNCSSKTLPVDLAPDGSAPNGKSGRQVAISGDGRFVAFVSRATNLVAGNSAVSLGYWELYVRDLCVGANAPSGCTPHTEIISTGPEGEAANGPSTSASVSADGRFIAFVSAATNLVAEKSTLLPRAYVRDTCAGPTATKSCVARTVTVPVDDEDRVAGVQAGRPAISSDGRYVALEIWAAKSAAQNPASTSQIVLADTCMGIGPPVSCEESAERISYAPDDSTLGGVNISPSLSSDARFVVFESQPADSSAANTAHVSRAYLRDNCLGATAPDGCVPATTLITNDSTTAATKTQNFSPAISASGRYVSFISGVASTVPAGQVATEGSLVVRDTCFGAVLPCTPHTYAVSEAAASLSATHSALVVSTSNNKSAPLAADRYSTAPLSADGRFAAFYAPDTIAAQPASGVGDVYLAITPF